MSARTLCVVALALAWSASLPARAQDAELSRIREEIRQLKEAYERRIQGLENRLAEAEVRVAKAGQGAVRTDPAVAQPGTRAGGENAFNPAISLILQGTAARSSQDPAAYQITGFAPSGGEVAPAGRSFSLGESELVLTANIDPYFRGLLIAALTPENEVEVEEASFQTLALGHGLTLKGGRFLSGVGYQNEVHQHFWDFYDAPLAYKAFLGGRLNDDGVQLKWVAPTELFVELGAELGRGRGFRSTEQSRNRAGAWSLFAHVGGDIGASTAWRAGLSHLRVSPRERAFEDADSLGNPVSQSFSGTSKLWIADFVLKWAPGGNATATNFKLQGEYFRRTESGSLMYDDSAQAVPQFGASFTDDYRSRQSGWYLQGVYQFMPRWRFGYRHDRLDFGSVNNRIVASGLGPAAADFPLLMSAHNPTRNTLMLDWSPTEFSRLRLQLASDRSRLGVTDNQALIQYIFSLGAHGAHRF
ncbi:MAG: hypothetical protein EPO29_02020 [Betaproteobacteria bacterium]|nr:MAG: hypothetical protein EPO29_02020 [Betaproteobacteria bacterium]